MTVCPECQFDYDAEDETTIPDRLRTLGRRYQAPLTRFLPGEDGAALLRSHPVEGTWSALEYACHLRDVLPVQLERLALALAEDVPEYVPMGREELVVTGRYAEQDPVEVSAAIAAGADALASAFEALDPDQWSRRGLYNYPEPKERTMRWLGQHTIHEEHHHLLDIGRVLRAARGR